MYRFRYKRPGASDFTSWIDVQEEETRIGVVSSSEDVAVELQAVDRAGNVSATKTTMVAISPDEAGPVFAQDPMLEGGATSTGFARLSWLAPVDNGSATATAAGVKDYLVKYRSPGGGWSETRELSFPWLDLQGAAIGASYELELRARDWAGNVGPVKFATTELARYQPCDDSRPDQGECAPGDTDETSADDGADGDVVGDLEEERSAATAQRSATYPARRYLLRSDDSFCINAEHRCYATFRSFAKSFVVGLVRISHRERNPKINTYVYSAANRSKYYYGELSAISDGTCRWIGFETTAGQSQPRETSCDPAVSSGPPFDWSRFQFPDFKGNNCFQASTEKPLYKANGRRDACGGGTALFLERAADLCPDVGLNINTGRTRGCRTNRIRRLSAGSCVDWRYLTRDGNWVMVTDTFNSNNQTQRGGWGFVPRSAFSAARKNRYRDGENTGGWPGYLQRGTCANPRP